MPPYGTSNVALVVTVMAESTACYVGLYPRSSPYALPAPLSLCILDPIVQPPPEAPRSVAFLARLHGGTRERRALRDSVEKKDARQ
jgi:hypothetical protein